MVSLCCVIGPAFVYFMLTKTSVKPEATYKLAWSPEGNLVAFECVFFSSEERKRQLQELFEPYFDYSSREICVADFSQDEYIRLSPMQTGVFPSWSPDGRYLAWYSPPNSLRVWDKELEVVTDYESPLEYIDFSSSGRGDGLAWTSDSLNILLQGPGLKLNLLSGEYEIRLPVEDGVYQCCFTWSPNGRYLAFISHERLLVYEADTPVFLSDTNVAAPMTWSNNGEILAWSKGSWLENELAITIFPTTTTRILDTSREVSFRYPTWGFGSESIAVRGDHTIYVLSLDLSGANPPGGILIDTIHTTPDISLWSSLSMSPDGQSIAYDSEEGSIVFVFSSGTRHALRDLLPSISGKPSEELWP